MAIIKPFRALRPNVGLAKKIAALPYDVMSSEEARVMMKGDNYSFLRIDRAEVNFPEPQDPHEPKVYRMARQILDTMIEKQQFIQDQTPHLYIYRQIMQGRAQTGLVCCTSIDDYEHNVIKKHEFTRPDKEQDRISHIKALDAQTGPIFQTYKDRQSITELINDWAETHQPLYEFSAFDVEHICWLIDTPSTIHKLVQEFAAVDSLYIADGHHRSAAAYRVGLEKRQHAPHNAEEEFNYFLSVLFPAGDLKIWPYYRLVGDLAGLSQQQFLDRIRQRFWLEEAPTSPYQPAQKGDFGMYLKDHWYRLTPKAELPKDDLVNSLDVSVLQDHLLAPILGIQDPRTDQRIEFVGGIRGLGELERRVKEDMQVAFSIFPTSIQEIIAVADDNQVMPPKSTWFEPKLLSGLFIHRL